MLIGRFLHQCVINYGVVEPDNDSTKWYPEIFYRL